MTDSAFPIFQMMVNSYSPGAFTIELAEDVYPIAHDLGLQDKHIQSALLHEYVHYLQDTVTYYGVKYRGEYYSGTIDKLIAGGNDGSALGYPYMGGDFAMSDDGRLLIDGEIVGATAIKENMARQAELYVFGSLKGATYNAMTYKAITMFTKCFSEELSKNHLAMFVIDDCCLGTLDPSTSIVTLMEHIDIQSVEGHLKHNDKDLVSWLYPMIHAVFESKNILFDQAIDISQFNTEKWKMACYTGIAKQIYATQAICNANGDDVMALISKIEEAYHCNATLRHANHSVLTDSLIDFKQHCDFEKLFARYGVPLIKKTGTCDPKDSNLDIILQ